MLSDRAMFLWHEQEKHLYTQELHDTVLQEQIVFARAFESLMKDYAAMPSEDIVVQFEKLHLHQQDIIYSIRQYCLQLRSPVLSGEVFSDAITRLIDGVHLQSNIEVSSHITANFRSSSEIEGHLFRIIQELFRNAMKHSEATKVSINVRDDYKHIDIEYYDNGVGMEFTPEFIQKRAGHMGLSGLCYRTEILGGTISIESKRNQGVKVTIHIPYSLRV